MDIKIILILKEYLLSIFGYHFPREIINLIVLIYNKCIKPKINCGYNCTTLIKNHIYVWGKNNRGQFGLGHTKNINAPQKLTINQINNIKKIKCGLFHTNILTTRGEIHECSDNKLWQEINNIEKIKKINNGFEHTIALTVKNEVYVWGDNNHGQLGLGD